MRNNINNRTRNVVVGNRQGLVVVAGRDLLRALADAHLDVSRHAAKPYSSSSFTTKTTADSRRRMCAAQMAAAAIAEESRAGIAARPQCWQSLPACRPQAPASRS
jgi:hypothetical protein